VITDRSFVLSLSLSLDLLIEQTDILIVTIFEGTRRTLIEGSTPKNTSNSASGLVCYWAQTNKQKN
jgi:hypothetical protein